MGCDFIFGRGRALLSRAPYYRHGSPRRPAWVKVLSFCLLCCRRHVPLQPPSLVRSAFREPPRSRESRFLRVRGPCSSTCSPAPSLSPLANAAPFVPADNSSAPAADALKPLHRVAAAQARVSPSNAALQHYSRTASRPQTRQRVSAAPGRSHTRLRSSSRLFPAPPPPRRRRQPLVLVAARDTHSPHNPQLVRSCQGRLTDIRTWYRRRRAPRKKNVCRPDSASPTPS
jgi:hypothetical protein